MGSRIHWPGQVELQVFNLEQVTAIASSSRSEVFWAFSAAEPLSVNELSTIIKKSPQSIRYHVNELVKADLIFPVKTTKRHSRIEESYVRRGVECISAKVPVTKEYERQMNRGFRSMLRQMDRNRSNLMSLNNRFPEHRMPNTFRFSNMRVPVSKVGEIIAEMDRLMDKMIALESDEGLRVSFTMLLIPSMGEVIRLHRQLTGEEMVEQEDEFVDEE